MKPIATFVALLWSLAFAAAPPADKSDLPAGDPVRMAFDELVRAATDTDWPSELAAREELASLAQEAVPKVTEAARSHGEARVRRACYELLTSAFAKDERAVDTVVRYGLHDQDPQVRYHCAFLLGDLKVHHAERALRAALEARRGRTTSFSGTPCQSRWPSSGRPTSSSPCSPPCRTIRSWPATSATSV